MYIASASIENFKSFSARQDLLFEPGFNLLLGTNNAGKTTVLDVIDLEPNLNDPHRSIRTIPAFGGRAPGHSAFTVTLRTTPAELRDVTGESPLLIPISVPAGIAMEAIKDRVADFVSANAPFDLKHRFGSGSCLVRFEQNDVLTGEADLRRAGNNLFVAQVFEPAEKPLYVEIVHLHDGHQKISSYPDRFKRRIYRFSAQRRPASECAPQAGPQLDREATFLPYCINHLQTNDAYGHQILCEWIHRIFPSVQWVQAPPAGGGFQIRCLPNMPADRREDLATPMSRMGAGIGNVLAMLYVVLTARAPQVIAIDEPNAFLHPRALRELLAILAAEGKQHQFILTAHSADVLTAVNAKSITLLEFDGSATTTKQIGPKDLHSLRGALADLGIRMTDLHAKDRVLWVEGQTEELVMPELLRWACSEVAAGVAVLRVERTGTFSKKGIDPIEVSNLYDRLSSASALVPPMVCILLDGEKVSKTRREDVKRESKGKLRYLDRRMLENFLLHPAAIRATLQELGIATDETQIESTLVTALALPSLTSDISEVDAAKVLSDVFSNSSNATHEFRKTRDTPTLVSWILENDPDFLNPLRLHLREIFGL